MFGLPRVFCLPGHVRGLKFDYVAGRKQCRWWSLPSLLLLPMDTAVYLIHTHFIQNGASIFTIYGWPTYSCWLSKLPLYIVSIFMILDSPREVVRTHDNYHCHHNFPHQSLWNRLIIIFHLCIFHYP